MDDPVVATAPPSVAPRWLATVAAGLVLAAVVGAAVWWHRSPDLPPVAPPATTGAATEIQREARAAATVAAIGPAWEQQGRGRFLRAFGAVPEARAWAAELYRNLRLLGARDVTWRYVAEREADPAASGPAGGFTADVEVAWTPGRRSGFASRPTATVTVPMTFTDRGNHVALVGTAPSQAGDPLPVWLAGPLDLARVPGAVCIGVGTTDMTPVTQLTRTAVSDVTAVLGRPPTAVVVVPADGSTAGHVLGSRSSELEQIAAVTTTIDGSSAPKAPVQVVLNPPVYDSLAPEGAQVVLTHEITHAITGATASAMPLWVAEGFADFVALHDGEIPVATAAGQILAEVRRHGPPKALPSPLDFAASSSGLARTYESAWLIFRMLAERYGDPATVAFYERVRDGAPLRRALRVEFGIDRQRLTASWRGYLERLAGA